MAAPPGNKFASHDKPWTRALQRHVQQNPDLLRRIAIATFAKAEDGDLGALKEIADRLDGKPAQSVDISGSLNTGKTAKELTNDELAAIATGSGGGVADEAEGVRTVN